MDGGLEARCLSELHPRKNVPGTVGSVDGRRPAVMEAGEDAFVAQEDRSGT